MPFVRMTTERNALVLVGGDKSLLDAVLHRGMDSSKERKPAL
jgi:hypothetical protein